MRRGLDTVDMVASERVVFFSVGLQSAFGFLPRSQSQPPIGASGERRVTNLDIGSLFGRTTSRGAISA
jgi:hypothetical protein